jgi:putative GTP pyrophosphokinase
VATRRKRKSPPLDVESIRVDYEKAEPRARRLQAALLHEIELLLSAQSLPLAVPLEGRVKSWESLREKLDRKSLSINTPIELDDFVGIRVILLFRSDLAAALDHLSKTFNVLSIEDTSQRLAESQFGYQSQHLIVRLRDSWEQVPSFADLMELKAEIQVRTIAQHIWAAASHKLQYKQEQSVPPPLRRTIFRISALLETVDLELDRVLEERLEYSKTTSIAPPDACLNVDLIAAVLTELLPAANNTGNEDYADLMLDLQYCKVNTVGQLRKLVQKHLKHALDEERATVADRQEKNSVLGTTMERIAAGVYFSHVGLARLCARQEFGDDVLTEFWLSMKKKSPDPDPPTLS